MSSAPEAVFPCASSTWSRVQGYRGKLTESFLRKWNSKLYILLSCKLNEQLTQYGVICIENEDIFGENLVGHQDIFVR